jgi:hypothetical protein
MSTKRLLVLTSAFAIGLGTAAFAQSGAGSGQPGGPTGGGSGGGASMSTSGTTGSSSGTMNGGANINAPVNTGSQGDSTKTAPASGVPSSGTLVPGTPNATPKSNPGPTQPPS